MCGVAGVFGAGWHPSQLDAMAAAQAHRGPDDRGAYVGPHGGLAHNRLSIIDLSSSGHQPMSTADERFWIVFNGELYNYLELREQLAPYRFRTATDTEVILAAFERWGAACLDRFIGMFAFLIWDAREARLFAARDRFGVKPLFYCRTPRGGLMLASEVKALHAAGHPAAPDPFAWATYLAEGHSDCGERTFWQNVRSLPGGHCLVWHRGALQVSQWYDVASRVNDGFDERPLAEVEDEYLARLTESVALRFRADVPVGIALSGGLDSSLLLGLVHAVRGEASDIKTFTFVTGDPAYDEMPWVERMLEKTRHPSIVCRLQPSDVIEAAWSMSCQQDEPYGGVPTLAYATVFAHARAEGVKVLLDGQGLDEQWAGYDYYASATSESSERREAAATVQGTRERAVRPECLVPEFRSLAVPVEQFRRPFSDRLRNLQYRDVVYTKIPRALRFNDRVSMAVGTELREPFLDHRLVELAFRQPAERKIAAGERKWLLRRIARRLVPDRIVEAPKRSVQTPQREWLRGPLRRWASECIETALERYGGTWLDGDAVRREWRRFLEGGGDNSFFVWQWIGLGLADRRDATRAFRTSFDSGVGMTMRRAIRTEDLGKRYRIGGAKVRYRTLRDTISGVFDRRHRRQPMEGSAGELWAIKNVSLDIAQGEVLGIIGRNGSGKSTLLKVLSRITEPTAGRAEVHGRVGSLLEVGTGFHNELSGRENIYLSGAILGMKRAEIRRNFDEIVEFAEVGPFVDTPLKHYSSGMYIRLAFGVAAHLEPSILMVDEVLAVGDIAFQRKCLGKLQQVGDTGRTVLFVSHDLTAISRLAPRTILLGRGEVLCDGPTREAITTYTSQRESQSEELGNRKDRAGDGLIRMESVRICDRDGKTATTIGSGEPVTIAVAYTTTLNELRGQDISLDMRVTDVLGHPITTFSTRFSLCQGETGRRGTLVCHIPSLALATELYSFDLWLKYRGGLADGVQFAGELQVIASPYFETGRQPVKHTHGAALFQHRWRAYPELTADELSAVAREQ